VGFVDKLKRKGRGVMTAAKLDEGAPAASPEEVSARLMAISGRGIETGRDGEEIVIAWAAKVASAGAGGASTSASIGRVHLSGVPSGARPRLCERLGHLPGDRRGRRARPERRPVGLVELGARPADRLRDDARAGLLGPHSTEGGADESGYKFSWSDLRDPVIDAVTGAGWTYKPKRA
jgi:hypothetical protein